jgi:putative transposase
LLQKGHLPRLAPEWYRGRAFVHWTFTVEQRATGWLTRDFHAEWKLVLLHASMRYGLVCPVYVLMPDHAHLLWLGNGTDSGDQRVAVEFLRKHTTRFLSPASWQQQAHDHVLREAEREQGTLNAIAAYIVNNPIRAELVSADGQWPYLGCSVPGYPDLNPTRADYWPLFWRIFSR